MNRLFRLTNCFVLLSLGYLLSVLDAVAAPLAAGKQKYLGGIHSGGTSAQETGIPLYWNQVTPENAGKWGSVEAVRGVYNWTALDAAYTLAKSNGLPFRFHVLFWGAQQPAWIRDLPDSEQLDAIKAWLAAVAARYPDIDYLEVVNEAFHDQPDITWKWLTFVDNSTDPNCGNYKKALGGNGASGWEWVLQAFRLARQYFPRTKLVLNDYGIISDGNATNNYVALINLLKAENLVDVIAEQAHAFNTSGASATNLTNNLNSLGATGLPIWITEFDIDGGTSTSPNDAVQLTEYQRVFPVLWEHPSVIGITTWGYRPGLWRNAQAAYIVLADGTERSAMTWLKTYVATTEPNLRVLIDSQPVNQSVNSGASATFSVVARGQPAPTFQWQKGGTNIAGATSATLAITNTQSADAGAYRVVVTNSFNSVTSNSATLSVTVTATAPLISTQPVSQTIAAGSAVTFTAAASGSPTPTFQWKKDGVDISGATNSSYAIASTAGADAGSYTVVATNTAGTATSNPATLTVIIAPSNAIVSITVE